MNIFELPEEGAAIRENGSGTARGVLITGVRMPSDTAKSRIFFKNRLYFGSSSAIL